MTNHLRTHPTAYQTTPKISNHMKLTPSHVQDELNNEYHLPKTLIIHHILVLYILGVGVFLEF